MHRERRKFLRSALKELATVLSDQPGLLGPKVITGLVSSCLVVCSLVMLCHLREGETSCALR